MPSKHCPRIQPPPPPPPPPPSPHDLQLPLAAVQALSIKAAVEEPQTDSERAVLLIERARDSKGPASRAGHLSQALQRLAALPAVQPPKPTGICHSLQGATANYSRSCDQCCVVHVQSKAPLHVAYAAGSSVVCLTHLVKSNNV